ncbi:unnamed protein product [Ambrosiozyma monospora]|uniref:Unnamed protein product n=1 Tax=Ambrosiozyma monospora TaxID=43982 RepID=A0ACB5SYX5_AMBMO|nr:unnamed protein product [Ambrosiozyma monospora]
MVKFPYLDNHQDRKHTYMQQLTGLSETRKTLSQLTSTVPVFTIFYLRGPLHFIVQCLPPVPIPNLEPIVSSNTAQAKQVANRAGRGEETRFPSWLCLHIPICFPTRPCYWIGWLFFSRSHWWWVLRAKFESKETKDAYNTPNPDIYGANMPAGANYENTTYQSQPPTEPANYVNPLGEPGEFGVTETAGKYPTYENNDGVVIEFTPERRKKMLRNLYIILAILVIIYIIWIVAVAVAVSRANSDDGYVYYYSYYR